MYGGSTIMRPHISLCRVKVQVTYPVRTLAALFVFSTPARVFLAQLDDLDT